MESFDHHQAARLQSLDGPCEAPFFQRVKNSDKIPALFAEIEFCVLRQNGSNLYARCLRLLLSQLQGLRGNVKSCHLPAALSEPNRIAALSHSNIQRSPRLTPAYGI